MDGSSNVYVAGFSTATWGSPVRAYTAGEDAFAARLDSSGELTWNTFLGGSEFDYGSAVVVDGSGNVYVAGFSAATWGAPVRAHYSGVNDDAFAARLDGSGELIWNTFLGGSGTDDGLDIAVDGSGNVYVTGVSNAAWGSPVRAYTAEEDAFAARLDSDGELTWNTFLGGSGGYYDYGDYGYDIAVDGSGNVYVAGSSAAAWGSPARAYTAGRDTFAARLNSGGGLTWNTFLGGSGGDYGFAGAVDGSGNVYVTGDSNAAWGSPMRGYTAGEDACVVKLPPFNTFADDDGVCGGNSPCYISFQTALDNVMTTGAVTYYPGTFNESVSLTENVTASHAGGGSVTIDGALAISAGTLDAPGADTLSLTGDLTRSGGTFSHNSGTFTFAGSGIQSITGDFAFNNLTVNSGATMDAGSNTVTVNGTLTNNGVVRQSRAVGGPGLLTFNLTGVQVNVTTQGSLSGLQTDWVESDHPNSPSGYTAARYWSVTPTGSGYTVGLILPHDSLSNPYVCRHTHEFEHLIGLDGVRWESHGRHPGLLHRRVERGRGAGGVGDGVRDRYCGVQRVAQHGPRWRLRPHQWLAHPQHVAGERIRRVVLLRGQERDPWGDLLLQARGIGGGRRAQLVRPNCYSRGWTHCGDAGIAQRRVRWDGSLDMGCARTGYSGCSSRGDPDPLAACLTLIIEE
jgi:hypothetical protein